jgi:ssDNA-binding replication factor A large subunit
MSENKYDDHINAVLSECPNADREEVREAFAKYESEFYIPPQDALRSIIRRFKGDIAPSSGASSSSNQKSTVSKKVASLTELSDTDKDIEIEVEIISHNLREQTIRGEQKQIAFGLLEDNPWDEGAQRTRWEYKDWGPNSNISPGTVVRIEGASVNEYQGKRSLNINQSTRIAVLREGTRPVVTPGEPIDINSIPNDGYVCVVGRILSSRPDQIHRKDGSGSLDVVRGRMADESGTIGFLSWEPFDHEVGALVKIDGAQVRTFRDTPELNFGRTTKVELYHDSNFADAESLMEQNIVTISQLRDGSRDVEAIVQITEWTKRSFVRDGQEKFLWSGQIADPSGKCRMSAWEELPISESDLPVTVKVRGVRVRAWQGIPDITVDKADQVEILESTPWDGSIDLSNHVVEVALTELVNGSSRVGISTQGVVASVREDCGIIMRCTQCRRVLRDGNCNQHGDDEGNQDVRLRLVIDDGMSTSSLLINKEATLNLLNTTEEKIKAEIDSDGQMEFVQRLRGKLLGRLVIASGRTIVDEQGAMILADKTELVEQDPGLISTEIRAQWGVQ